MAMRTGYCMITWNSERPLERATVTYCLRSSSSMVARMVRMMLAIPAIARMITGSQRCCNRLTNFAQLIGSGSNSGEYKPPTRMPKTA